MEENLERLTLFLRFPFVELYLVIHMLLERVAERFRSQ